MNEGIVVDLVRQGLTTVLFVAAPMLGVSLAIGLIISIFQATTQIHEQTLTFVPKVIGILLAISICGMWMFQTVEDYARGIFENINVIIR